MKPLSLLATLLASIGRARAPGFALPAAGMLGHRQKKGYSSKNASHTKKGPGRYHQQGATPHGK